MVSAPEVIAFGTLRTRLVGELRLAWSEVGLVRLDFADDPSRSFEAVKKAKIPSLYGDPLKAYFAGEDPRLEELPLDLRGTRFQLRVYRALLRVPYGAVRSYAGIAADIGAPRATRAVGMANSRNPVAIIVPCHRVVAAGAKLGGYSGGLERKRALLALEGVRIDAGHVFPGQLSLPIRR